MQERNLDLFENAPVPQAVIKNALPAIVSMLVVLVYNIADTFFVGQTGDPLKVAAVSIATPVFLLFMATGNLFGIGGTSVISRALGEGRRDFARRVSAFCFWAAIATGVVFMVCFGLFMDPVLRLIGASADTAQYAKEYLGWVALGAPFVIIATAFSNIVRAEGRPTEAMIGNMIGTITNIVLDPIMILWMGMGVSGAAIATVIGNIAGTVYYLWLFLRGGSMLSISPRDFGVRGIWGGVVAIGGPASFNNVLMSSSNILLNNFLAGYGDLQVAAMGVAMKANMIVVMLLIGLGAGIQPLLGYQFGARNFPRAKAIMRFTLGCAVGMGLVLTAVCWFGAGSIVRAFLDDPEVQEYGVTFVKALMVSGPVIGILFVLINALQAMGAAVSSLILSISRQGLIFMPMLFLLNRLFGLRGIVYAQPVADFLSIITASLLYTAAVRRRIARDRAAGKGNA